MAKRRCLSAWQLFETVRGFFVRGSPGRRAGDLRGPGPSRRAAATRPAVLRGDILGRMAEQRGELPAAALCRRQWPRRRLCARLFPVTAGGEVLAVSMV